VQPVPVKSGMPSVVKLSYDATPRSESNVTQGGPLLSDANPSTQELLDRAKYWDQRGRSDLAEKLRRQVKSAAPTLPAARIEPTERQITRSAPATAEAGMPAQPGAKPSSHELLERSKYWEVRGRTDLAEKLSAQAAVTKQVEVKAVSEKTVLTGPAGMENQVSAQEKTGAKLSGQTGRAEYVVNQSSVPDAVAAVAPASRMQVAAREKTPAAPTRQELDDKAQYWAARGRPDLADQLRSKLQQMEPASRTSREPGIRAVARNQDEARSALEDSLLKNPNSMKSRLDLAQIYRSIGEFVKARELINSVLATSPDLPDALFASAQLYADQRLWWETLHTLEKVSPVSRTVEMGRLQKIAWAHVQIDRADALVRQGDNAAAELLLRQVAAELVVSYNQTILPEPPPLWKSGAAEKQKRRR
jgi:FimV-like protein